MTVRDSWPTLEKAKLPLTAVGAILVFVGGIVATYVTTSARAEAAEAMAVDAAMRVTVVEKEQAVAASERGEQARDLAEHAVQAQRSLDRIESMVRELRTALIDERAGSRRQR